MKQICSICKRIRKKSKRKIKDCFFDILIDQNFYCLCEKCYNEHNTTIEKKFELRSKKKQKHLEMLDRMSVLQRLKKKDYYEILSLCKAYN